MIDHPAGGTAGAPALIVSDLRRSYGDVVALDGVDLRIEPGEVLALLGSNGAGKTTLIAIVAGLRRPDGGAIHVFGIDARAEPARARALIGLAPQELGIYPTVSVRENLAVFGELTGLRGAGLTGAIDRVAGALGLTGLLRRPGRSLSGGEKRRLHVAIAVLVRPALLLLDEPSTGMDVFGTRALVELVGDLAAEGTAVCYSTNDLAEADAVASTVAILDRGRLIARGPVQDLVDRHAGGAGGPARDRPRLETVFRALTGRPYSPDRPFAVEAAAAT